MALKNFEEMLALVDKKRPIRAAIAGSDSENLLQAVFKAQDEGFIQPILVGDRARTVALLEKLGLKDKPYSMVEVGPGHNAAKAAIEAINCGDAELLVRGNIFAHDFLVPVLDKKNGLYADRLISHVALASLPDYPRLMALTDMAVVVQPDVQKKKYMINNITDALQALGYDSPVLALLALVEAVTFHVSDTVEAQTIMMDQARHPFTDATLWGPISYDLIFSKEAARLKGYNCPYCGEGFDGIIAPELTLANTLIKSWTVSEKVKACGAVIGATVPISFVNRSASVENHYLSLAFGSILVDYYKEHM